MIIVADAGGTKTDWLVKIEGEATPKLFTTKGINPSVMSSESIESVFRQLILDLESSGFASPGNVGIHLYCAGCNSESTKILLETAAQKVFPGNFELITIASDLLGAARATLGNKKGIACILGTGSASGLYDGDGIIDSIPSLGFILGDEGSGAFMGKTLINRYFKRELSSGLMDSLREFCNMDMPEILAKVYKQPGSNGFLASFVPFLSSNRENEEIYDIITYSLKLFFEKNVLKYNTPEIQAIGFVGGVAVAFREEVIALSGKFGFETIEILSRPIFKLGDYHFRNH